MYVPIFKYYQDFLNFQNSLHFKDLFNKKVQQN